MIRLVVPGPPTGKGRPRFVKATGRTFTPGDTMRAEQRVQLAWMDAGRPVLNADALTLYVEAVLERPRGHWRTNGSLSAAGLRAPLPTKKPDADNALKLVMDAMNGLAYRDDVLVVDARVVKRWAMPGEQEHTLVVINEALTPSMVKEVA